MDHLPPRSEEATKKLQEGHRKGRSRPSNLREQVDEKTMMMWPTPTTKGYGHGSEGQYQNLYNKMMQGIITQKELEIMTATKMENHRSYKKMQKMWATPRSSPAMSQKITPKLAQRGKGNLEEQVAQKMWPTPTANEDAAGRPGGKMQKMLGNHPEVRNKGEGTLNADWVEWLMGYPRGWTSL
jgi:hypothetical protein